ncbi:MAG: hopanoid biosynthesis protein HpnM [Rhodospirillaceae bacterium]|nr:hopanoid biosynthesis protein HpnM [Rhodospirillaceae bacterium]|tara:strand:+ start:133 stop:774 length:642 start_codon:yes stop_codon:yes gene_type:complete
MKLIAKLLQTMVVGLLLTAPQALASEKPADNASAKQVIEKFNTTLLHVMKRAKVLGYHGRYASLDPVLSKTFDFPFMIQYAVGQTWKSLSDDQKHDLTKAFARFTIATYADRFNGYSGEQIKIVKAQAAPRDTRLIKTELIKKNGKAIKLNYLMRNNGHGWQIIDIFLKGSISELATKRSEYNATAKNEGFHGLISRINEKTAIIQAQRSSSK